VPFVAEEEIPVVQPLAWASKPKTPDAPAPRTARAAVPVAPRRRRPARRSEEPSSEPTASPDEAVPEVPDPEHDPHLPPVAGLPVSVLVGLALLPFGIPMLWRVAPLITGQEAALSLAVPISLAIAAAALCLGVVYTIDWTAATRIKGVLMLVGLAYLTGAGLFFLKKDLMDRVRALGEDQNQWSTVFLNDRKCRVRMPGQAWQENNQQPLPGLVQMSEVRRAEHAQDPQDGPRYEYWVAVSKADPAVKKPDDVWFARVGEKLKDAGGKLLREEEVKHQELPGRQWTFEVGNAGHIRIVRVFVINSHVYYLSAEGPNLSPNDDDFGKPFFGSFLVDLN
jgi:hypothetical protein